MIVTIDAGNSYTKIGLFEQGQLTNYQRLKPEENILDILPLSKKLKIIICSVSKPKEYFSDIFSLFPDTYFLTAQTKVPINNLYSTPDTLGMDRLAAVIGGSLEFSQNDCLIIDAGTCITYDFIDKKKNYLGGSISPGLSIRFKSLRTFTSRLPEINVEEIQEMDNFNLTGTDTRSAIISGIVNGTVAEIEGIMAKYSFTYENLKVVLCGGDAHFFETKIKQSIFAIPNLIHWGLFRIINHNEAEK